jgi:hypothetical protein
MSIYVVSSRTLLNCVIAFERSRWAFDASGLKERNIIRLDKRCSTLARNDLLILYSADPHTQGIVAIGHVHQQADIGAIITDLWVGSYRNPISVIWWNKPSPTRFIPITMVKRQLPMIRRRGNAQSWQLHLGTNIQNFINGQPNNLNIHDLFFMYDHLAIDTSIERAHWLIGLRLAIPPEEYGAFDDSPRRRASDEPTVHESLDVSSCVDDTLRSI